MLSVCSDSSSIDDEKKYHMIVKEAEVFNESELVSRFNYKQLTVEVLICQLKYFKNFYTKIKFLEKAEHPLFEDRKTEKFILLSAYYCSIHEFEKAYLSSEKALESLF
jgi:hypothetical protein